MVTWRLVYTAQARKDAKKIQAAGLREKAEALLNLIAKDPYATPPPLERLLGDLKGAISRRINIQHRLVYQVLEAEETIKILRMWTHYE